MILLPSLLLTLWGGAGRCLGEVTGFEFDGAIRRFAVATNTVYVATEERLFQLSHDLTPVLSVSQRGVLTGGPPLSSERFDRVSERDEPNATFSIDVLLPQARGNLTVCGVVDNGCGYCEVLGPWNISHVLYREHIEVGSLWANQTSVSLLVDVETRIRRESYILVAMQPANNKCSTRTDAVNLQNTNENQSGSIFSTIDDFSSTSFKIHPKKSVQFVDGFQINVTIFLFSNVASSAKSNKVRLIWLEGKTNKIQTLKFIHGAVLNISDAAGSSRLVASAVIPGGPPVLWGGVFSVDGTGSRTELVLFDISPDLSGGADTDPDFCSICDPKSKPSPKEPKKTEPKTLRPKAVLFRQNHMTSVLAVRQRSWMVFFIGTGDGQLIKLAVDNNYHTACPRILYRANDDRPVLPKILLDPVDPRYVYVPLKNQMKRVAVSKCSIYTNKQECWLSQDPYCVWCSSKTSCTFEDDCKESDWVSIPDDSRQKKVFSSEALKDKSGRVTLSIEAHMTAGKEVVEKFACQFSTRSRELCSRENPPPLFPRCTCILSDDTLPTEGLDVVVKIRLGSSQLLERVKIFNCSDFSGPSTSALCRQCVEAGCGWSTSGCSWADQGERNDTVCQTVEPERNFSKPEIFSITPSVVSFYGRNNVVLVGRNLGAVTRVRMWTNMDCTPQESPVLKNVGTSLTFHIPSAEKKGVVKVCLVLPDGSCHGNGEITYLSSPSCTAITPNSTWLSGRRRITLRGSHLDFVEGILHSNSKQEIRLHSTDDTNYQSLQDLPYDSPAAENTEEISVSVLVANESLTCLAAMTYYPEPHFTSFTSTRTGDDVLITIQKTADRLNMSQDEVSVWAFQREKKHSCIMRDKESSNKTDYFICEINNPPDAKFQRIMIKYGGQTVMLDHKASSHLFLLMLLVLLLIPCIIVVVVIIYQSKQKKLTVKMNQLMEDLELDIRNDIRQGFVDLQTEKTDLMENVGAIPFLDYKHFASRIFFPESDTLMKSCIKDMGQDAVKMQLDSCCQGLSRLIQDQFFLTSMVHALEEQKSFTIKDKCVLASLLTIALHNNLSYLTEVMEALLGDLMQQSSNTQPKLLLRRTESIVEKLLTNWMSICLYGFLRESVGQHLFLMVNALTQQTAKGPVDCVTEKALYTLSEDWLLWQAQDFTALRLRVLFAVGSDGEVSEPLEVSALSCDTVEQLKEKILSTFKAKFGFPYSFPLRDVCIECERDGSFVLLQEVDASSEVIGEVTMLNTLKHYKVSDGATIKVLSRKTHRPVSPQSSVKDDENFSGKYFHLIDPDVVEDPRKNPERKKLKLKEVHLTKLLSTKVAVHSFVENLFRSIWGLQHGRAPSAVKYFFDFLDAQADKMKITEPDVLHIWKTNSLPLRFWVNILKNPQFVFDIEKTPNLDGCLSVIAQAFMDSFSLSDTQLGKHAPTNKLLYAKDIPMFKQEVKAYYRQVRDQPAITHSEFNGFLLDESKKHENEFNEAAALRELYKFIQRYFTEIQEKLDQNGAPTELKEQLHHVKNSFDQL